MVFRPATPGFVVTLAATVLLAIVTFSVPYFKSIFFLKASLAQENVNGTITFGVLGYCIELTSNTTCSSPRIGWEFNPNQLLGDKSIIQIPSVVVQWITYVLVLHIVGFGLAAIAAVFGLLAHIREMSMSCFSSCIAGFAASVTMIAFFFDIAFFYLVKDRINAVDAGSAAIGNAVWLTLISWVLLFFSGCFYRFGRCCLGGRPRGSREPKKDDGYVGSGSAANGLGGGNTYADQMRLDAVKAEADRKARQKQGEVGLPAFTELEHIQPLTSEPQYLDEEEDTRPYRDHQGAGAVATAYRTQSGGRVNGGRQPTGGYAPAAPGTRAVDEYYTLTNEQSSYPPQPQRQGSTHTQAPSAYATSTFGGGVGTTAAVNNQYLSASGQYGHEQYPSAQDYGHTSGGTTYHSAQSHQQYPTNYSQYPDSAQPQQQPSFNADTYNATGLIPGVFAGQQQQQQQQYTSPYSSYAATSRPTSGASAPSHPQSFVSAESAYYTPRAHMEQQPERSYTLGGGGYGQNVVPDPYNHSSYGSPYTSGKLQSRSPLPPVNTNFAGPSSPTSPRGPRGPRNSVAASPVPEEFEESPPVYDMGTAQPPGVWSSKR